MLLAVSGCGHAASDQESVSTAGPDSAASGPADASYLIERAVIRLHAGRAAYPAAPGAAEMIETRLFGSPAWGDLDGDGEEDAAVLLWHRRGGSGGFYYVAAAIRRGEGVSGTNAILLGDRIAPQSIQIRNGVMAVNFADRRPEEAMTTAPSEEKTKYFTLRAGQLSETLIVGVETRVLEGWVTIGHEVRAFQPCGYARSVWLDPASDGFEAVRRAYAGSLPADARPYTPVFMTLAGRLADAHGEGFGGEYGASFRDARFIQAWPYGNCRSD